MLERDPNIIIKTILDADYVAGNTDVAAAPRVSTGWYNFIAGGQLITVTNTQMGAVNGGVSGITATNSDGGLAQLIAGTTTVNCWAGTFDDCTGIGTGGVDVNPKAAAYSMAREVYRALTPYAGGTTHNGSAELLSLVPDNPRQVVETGEERPAVYRYELLARFVYSES